MTRSRLQVVVRSINVFFAAFCLSLVQARGADKLTIEFLDIGQGDSVLITSPEGKHAIVDGGPLPDSAADALDERGITSIDLMVLSHHHLDHYGGLKRVAEKLHPKYYLESGSDNTSTKYVEFLEAVEASGAQAVFAGPEQKVINLGTVKLTVLPQPPQSDEENDNSVGLRVAYGNTSALMTGDSEIEERDWWRANCPNLIANCDLLKLAHHGSYNGTNSHWLSKVAPKMAAVSCGEGNSYGHPHSDTLALLHQFNIPLHRTDTEGSLKFECDGTNWRFVESEGGHGRFWSAAVAAAPERSLSSRLAELKERQRRLGALIEKIERSENAVGRPATPDDAERRERRPTEINIR